MQGETAEQLEAKRPYREDFRVHSVVLAVQSAYFRQRLLAKAASTQQFVTGPAAQQQGNGAQPLPQLQLGDGQPPNDSDDAHRADGGDADAPSLGAAPRGAAGSGDEIEPSGALSGKPGRRSSNTLQQQQQPEGGRVYMYSLEERLAPSDLPAARAVLRHMYTEELVFDSPSQLVSVLKIADKWKAADTIDACRAAFAHLEPEDLDLDVIKQVREEGVGGGKGAGGTWSRRGAAQRGSVAAWGATRHGAVWGAVMAVAAAAQVYSLEGIIHDVQNFAELVAAVQSRLVSPGVVGCAGEQQRRGEGGGAHERRVALVAWCACSPAQVQMFQDIADVVQNPTTRNLFLQLPFAAVMALLRSPQVRSPA